jgi:uncharacterized protein YerC
MTARDLVELVGPDVAMTIALACGGSFQSMPTQKAIHTACRNLGVQILSAKGRTMAQISAATGLSEDSIVRIIKASMN